uniref:Cytochrome P450 2K1-like n=1 Tax=Cyprinus carpio TaxID=7962 RepID=A0A8C1MPU0_CYPCA
MSVVESLLQFSSTGTLLGALLLLLVLYLLSSGSESQKEGKEPPGPKPLPLLGNLLTLDLMRPFDTFFELSKTYGNIFQVFLGPKKTVVLVGYKTVREALVNHVEEFGDRDIAPSFRIMNDENNWKEMRCFALCNLRDLGMGKRGSEEKIIEEIQYLKGEFDKFEGKPFDTTRPVNYAVSNIISSIVYGSIFEYTDPRFTEMVNSANENVYFAGSTSMMVCMLYMLTLVYSRDRIIVKNIMQSRQHMAKLINGLLETLNPHDSRGFVESFLIRKQSDEARKTFFHQDNLMMSVTDLFIAGTDSTGTTLRWGLTFMAKYPHIQDRVQEEIDRVIGGRQPVVEDRKKLPYTDAVIHETQRLANIVPLNLPHITNCDVTFNGYFIKKGTTVVPLLTSVLKDPSEWEKPNSFYPEHFLDEKGQFVKRDAFMPFSAGQ